MAVNQGAVGAQYKDAVFKTQSHTIVTGWPYAPYQPTASSMGLCLNGGECVGEVYVSGMGETIVRAEWTI